MDMVLAMFGPAAKHLNKTAGFFLMQMRPCTPFTSFTKCNDGYCIYIVDLNWGLACKFTLC